VVRNVLKWMLQRVRGYEIGKEGSMTTWLAALGPLVWGAAAFVAVLVLARRTWAPPSEGTGTDSPSIHIGSPRSGKAAA
jgi:hypothetical protein